MASVWCESMLFTFVYTSLRVIWITLNNLYSIPSYLIWILLLQPLRLVRPALYWRLEGTMFNWMLSQVAHWVQSAGYTVLESGKDLSPFYDDEALVIVNHQSTADVPIIMNSFASKKGVCAGMMWIMDYIFMYSNFGWVSLLHGDFFILQGTKNGRSDQMANLEKHIRSVYQNRPRKWIVLFPEGGFLRKRLEGSQRFARTNNFPVLNHVALPRVGALETLLKNLHPNNAGLHRKTIKWVIDMTIAYPSGKPLDAMRLAGGWEKPVPTHIFYRVFPISEVPAETDHLQKWLFTVYSEKEKLLDSFYKTGHFQSQDVQGDVPGETCHERVVRISRPFLWSLHAFHVLSLSLQYYCLKTFYQYLF